MAVLRRCGREPRFSLPGWPTTLAPWQRPAGGNRAFIRSSVALRYARLRTRTSSAAKCGDRATPRRGDGAREMGQASG